MTDGVATEWLILADHAEVVSNKLYLMGGGWDRFTVNTSFPAVVRHAIAVSLRVPWNETNRRHNFELEIATEDGKTLAKLGGQFEAGRPPGIPAGVNQRVQLALNASIKVESPGLHVIIARIGGQESARTHFNVVAGPGVKLPEGPRS